MLARCTPRIDAELPVRSHQLQICELRAAPLKRRARELRNSRPTCRPSAGVVEHPLE